MRAAVSVVIVRIAGTVLQFALAVLLARGSGPEITGSYYIFVSYSLFFSTFVGFGLPTYILKQVSKNWAVNTTIMQINSIIIVSYVIIIVTVVILYLIWLFLGFGELLLNTNLLAISVALSALLKINVEAIKGLRLASLGIALEFVVIPLLTAGVLSGLYLIEPRWVESARNIQLLYVLSQAATLVLSGVVLAWQSKPPVHAHYYKRLLYVLVKVWDDRRQLSGFWISMIATNLQWALPYIFLPYVADREWIGYFSIAHRLVGVYNTMRVALLAYFSPMVAEAAKRCDRTMVVQTYFSTIKYIVLIFSIISLIYLTFPDEILSLFGGEFIQATQVLVLLALGRLSTSIWGLPEAILLMAGNPWHEAISYILSYIIFILISYLAIQIDSVSIFIIGYNLFYVIKYYSAGFFVVRLLRRLDGATLWQISCQKK